MKISERPGNPNSATQPNREHAPAGKPKSWQAPDMIELDMRETQSGSNINTDGGGYS